MSDKPIKILVSGTMAASEQSCAGCDNEGFINEHRQQIALNPGFFYIRPQDHPCLSCARFYPDHYMSIIHGRPPDDGLPWNDMG